MRPPASTIATWRSDRSWASRTSCPPWRAVTGPSAGKLGAQTVKRHHVGAAAGHGGRLIAVTSVHEHQPCTGSAAYDAAKHGSQITSDHWRTV
jgi:hypothetical protein